jgi:hypothetical protein
VLEGLGVDPLDLARCVDRLLEEAPSGYPAASADWDFDTLVEPLLRQSIDEAMSLGQTLVGAEDLLLAIIRLADLALSSLLQDRLVVYSREREVALGLHLNHAQMAKGVTRSVTAKCPKCGKVLRTDRAKQCFHCGADWHNRSGSYGSATLAEPDAVPDRGGD